MFIHPEGLVVVVVEVTHEEWGVTHGHVAWGHVLGWGSLPHVGHRPQVGQGTGFASRGSMSQPGFTS